MCALTVYLIRHGETEWAITGRHTGNSDIPLTARGESEARELRASLGQLAFTAVLASPMQRARRTCELAGAGASVEIEPDLAEWNYGDYEGRRSVDIALTRPGWNVFRDGCPNGEMPSQVSARADAVIRRVCALEGNVALFSHGQFGCVLGARWIGLAALVAQHLAFGPASRSILSFGASHPDVRTIELWNVGPATMVFHDSPPSI